MADPVGLVTEIPAAPWSTPVRPQVNDGLVTVMIPRTLKYFWGGEEWVEIESEMIWDGEDWQRFN